MREMSSPRYAQANGAADRAVQTAQSILGKAADPFLALLNYRKTSLNNGCCIESYSYFLIDYFMRKII